MQTYQGVPRKIRKATDNFHKHISKHGTKAMVHGQWSNGNIR